MGSSTEVRAWLWPGHKACIQNKKREGTVFGHRCREVDGCGGS